MTITHPRLVTVPVSDQDRARAFHVDPPGFEVVAGRQTGHIRWLQAAPEGAQTTLALATAGKCLTPGSAQGIILEATDVDVGLAELARAAVSAEGPPGLPPGRQATLTDPDGNSFGARRAGSGG